MKRVLFALIFLFIIIPSSYAIIELNEITPKIYNLGDKIKISSSVLRENSFDGILKIHLLCDREKVPLNSRILKLSANERYNFLDEFTIPIISTGDCFAKVFIEENGNLIEEKSSENFKITKELSGNFVLVNSKVQLGSNVDITGDVFKVNGKRIEGIATIYFKRNKNISFIDTKDIKEGRFMFSVPSNYTNVGSYSVDFDIRDANGNENIFQDAIIFEITNLLNLDLKLDKDKVNPGGNFEVIGSVNNIYGKRVDRGSFIVRFKEKELKGDILLGDINQKIAVDNNIKTGFHNIFVEVTDEAGNKGSGNLNIEVLGKASKVELKIEKDSYKPGDGLKISAIVYDQGRDLVDKDIEIEIRDSSGVKRIDKTIKREFTFSLPLISRPGEWSIKATSGALKDEKKFYVTEIKDINYKVEGQMLVVTNIGNVAFDDILNINLDGVTSSSSISKKVFLDLGESMSIDFGKEVTTGIYKVTINDKLFDNVKIEGRSLIDYRENINLIFVLLVILVLGVLLYKKRGGFKFDLKKYFRKERKEFTGYVDDIGKVLHDKMEQKERFVKKEMQHLRPKLNTFTEYITIKPREDKLNEYKQKSSYLKKREKEKTEQHYKEGLFNMFNDK